jgi:hypothetical protein
MAIRFEDVNKENNNYKDVKDLYSQTFRREKQAPFWFVTWKSKKEFVDFLSIYDGDDWIGFICLITEENLTYLMYLEIDEKVKIKGYESKVMSAIRVKYFSNRIILAFEEIHSKMRKRLSFKYWIASLICSIKLLVMCFFL